MGPPKKIFSNPRHPYSQALLSAVPIPDPDNQYEQILLTGDVPSPVDVPPGCTFNTRCPQAKDQCRLNVPALVEVENGHFVACSV
jgi:oligopeptide/dipeptide ABC transporter ATP-binding protein